MKTKGCRQVALVLVVAVVILITYLTTGRNEKRSMETFEYRGHRLNYNDHFSKLLRLYQQKMEVAQTNAQQAATRKRNICTNSLPWDEECVDQNCNHTEPESLPARLHSVVNSLHPTDIATLNRIMQFEELQVQPTGKQILFITAASSNHFLESQAMLKNFHETVPPNFSNYSLVYYDIGLTIDQRTQVVKHCKCEVRTFPLQKLESWMRKLKCYIWKALVVQANIKAADMLVWMDASVRLTMEGLKETLQDAQIQGINMRSGHGLMSQHIDTHMMNYFNTTACFYSQHKILGAALIFLQNGQFVRDAVITPWAVCAVNRNCMCPENSQISCNNKTRKYGKCHRYDQAGLSMILTKLFGNYMDSLRIKKLSYTLKRGDKFEYFDYLESKNKAY
ncbi:uncharacterized protein [Haliotis cracherodii]|uniref:uncharacterized protein n=1 Tax=Haliotis cracherodii TaxID=6455 RepID=UPI0039ED9A12